MKYVHNRKRVRGMVTAREIEIEFLVWKVTYKTGYYLPNSSNGRRIEVKICL